MVRNYFVIAFRNIRKNKASFYVNLFGLAIGLTGCLLIYQYVSFETSYNSFHADADDLYRVSYSKEKDGIESFHTVLTYSGVGPSLKENFPEVVEFARLRPASVISANSVMTYDGEVYEEKRVYYADQSFLEIFSFEIKNGDPRNLLSDQFAMVISESMAIKYFGNEDPIGKTIQQGGNRDFTVTGVFKDIPLNSHVKFDFLLAHSTLKSIIPEPWTEDNITRFHGHLYLLLVPGTAIDDFEEKLPSFVDEYVGGNFLKESGTILKLHPMPIRDIHLKSSIEHEPEVNGDEKSVKYLSIIAIIILIIAWVNNVNHSTARAIERAGEVGVRKSLGALRLQLKIQFLLEATIANTLAVTVALLLFVLAQPVFDILDLSYMTQVAVWINPEFWIVIILLLITGIIITGIYPAFLLSSYNPIDVLRGGSFSKREGASLRKLLVIFQFAASVALIIGTAIVYFQIAYLRKMELGINVDQSIVVRAPLLADSTYTGRIQSFKTDLLRNTNVQSVVATNDIPGREFNSATWFRKITDSDDNAQFMYLTYADEDFISSMGVELLAGRGFTPEDNQFAIIINEKALNLLDYETPEDALGNEITFMGSEGDYKLKIVGITKNYHHLSPKLDYAAMVMGYSQNTRTYYVVHFNVFENAVGNVSDVIAATAEAFNFNFENNPFSYFFLDEEFEKQYGRDKQFGNIFSIFSILALIVACLGLYGLSSFTILRRTKEIGIRKVLGSSVGLIVKSLSLDYLKLVLISNLFAWPIIYYVMNAWLEAFASHIAVPLWIFPVAGIIVGLLAILTVSFHSITAALANPVDSLKYE